MAAEPGITEVAALKPHSIATAPQSSRTSQKEYGYGARRSRGSSRSFAVARRCGAKARTLVGSTALARYTKSDSTIDVPADAGFSYLWGGPKASGLWGKLYIFLANVRRVHEGVNVPGSNFKVPSMTYSHCAAAATTEFLSLNPITDVSATLPATAQFTVSEADYDLVGRAASS
jgi:hypothetical protein